VGKIPRKPQGGRREPTLLVPERTKRELELQEDLDGCKLRLDQLTERHREKLLIKDATIARQREWIVELERRLALALNEVAELRGEGDDEAA
jgi:hypothetical protein